MADYVWWVIAGVVLLVVELLTGAYYLLALAVAAGITAIGAFFGLALNAQLFLAAIAAVLATIVAHSYRKKHQSSRSVQDNKDVLLDVGETVRVNEWDAHGHSRIDYRGSQWDVYFEGDSSPHPGEFRVKRIDGIRLVVGGK